MVQVCLVLLTFNTCRRFVKVPGLTSPKCDITQFSESSGYERSGNSHATNKVVNGLLANSATEHRRTATSHQSIYVASCLHHPSDGQNSVKPTTTTPKQKDAGEPNCADGRSGHLPTPTILKPTNPGVSSETPMVGWSHACLGRLHGQRVALRPGGGLHPGPVPLLHLRPLLLLGEWAGRRSWEESAQAVPSRECHILMLFGLFLLLFFLPFLLSF